MVAFRRPLPWRAVMDPADTESLAAALRPLLPRAFPPHGGGIVAWRHNEYTSSSPSLVVHLDTGDGTGHEVFIKFDRGRPDPEPRNRFGVDYSLAVHHRLLARAPWPCPRALGVVALGEPPRRALVMEHLGGCLRVGEAPDEGGIVAAAAWCGRYHAWAAGLTDTPDLGFLARQDADTYRAWSARAAALAAAAGLAPAWLARACAHHDAAAARLAASDRTILHGEFGVANVLWRDGAIFPVDWESAAVGPGAIDVAALVYGWPESIERRCRAAYWQARGTAPPPDDELVWGAALLHTGLRWLPAPGEPGGERLPAGLEMLARVATRLGLA
jgi:hypothetical protein